MRSQYIRGAPKGNDVESKTCVMMNPNNDQIGADAGALGGLTDKNRAT